MRHFEKKGGLFRELEVRGATLKLTVGRAANDVVAVSMRQRSPAEAKRRLDAWARLALDAGFTELELPPGRFGVVSTLETPTGPGRIRLDGPEDVYFDSPPAGPLPLRIGQRVLVQGVRTDPRLDVEYMAGSKLRARSVLAFPRPRWNQHLAPGADARAQRLLARLSGKALLGHQRRARPLPKDVPCGALIFAFEKGIHRFLKLGHLPDVGTVVWYEPVLTATFQRQGAPPLSCIPEFCERLPPALVRELESRLGLGEP